MGSDAQLAFGVKFFGQGRGSFLQGNVCGNVWDGIFP